MSNKTTNDRSLAARLPREGVAALPIATESGLQAERDRYPVRMRRIALRGFV